MLQVDLAMFINKNEDKERDGRISKLLSKRTIKLSKKSFRLLQFKPKILFSL